MGRKNRKALGSNQNPKVKGKKNDGATHHKSGSPARGWTKNRRKA